jgi:hypothetical protein
MHPVRGKTRIGFVPPRFTDVLTLLVANNLPTNGLAEDCLQPVPLNPLPA